MYELKLFCYTQIEAEKTRAEAQLQESLATKMKTENQAIRDEAEADLSGLLYSFMLIVFLI